MITPKNTVAIATLVLLTAAVSYAAWVPAPGPLASTGASTPGPQNYAHYHLVRTDFISSNNIGRYADTFVEITNLSPNQPLILGNMYAVNKLGVRGLLSTSTSLANTVVQPLGRARFLADASFFPGLVATQTTIDAGLAHVVVESFGPYPEQAYVTAQTESRGGGQSFYSRDVVKHVGQLIPNRP